ncbi:MAG: hypothetical protein JXR40_04235 [Pontiellaceae bacterium]|nr:hypothetical protein [Pontiellaceae bacterium]
MGITDRDYMREPEERTSVPKPKTRVPKAENKPPIIKRIQFWFWNLTRHRTK